MDRALSHSSMSCYRRCRYKYYLSYVRNYAPVPSGGLIRGSVNHAIVGAWYSGKSIEQALKIGSDMLCQYEELVGEDLSEDWELIELVMTRYFSWSMNNDKFSNILIEQKLNTVFRGTKFVAILDGIVEQNGVQWVLEHKFWKKVSLRNLDLDPQVTMYLWIARQLGFNPRGVLYNIVRMAKGGIAESEPVVRVPLYRNSEGEKYFEQELEAQVNDMRTFHDSGGSIYRTPAEDCSWTCGFFDVCLSVTDNGDASSVLAKYPRKKFEMIGDEPDDASD